MKPDLSAVLPDGNLFAFWEKDCAYDRILYVDGANPAASDENNGSDPDRLGKKVVRLSRHSRMPLRRRIASPDQHLAVFLHRVLPGRLFSSIISSYYRTYRNT